MTRHYNNNIIIFYGNNNNDNIRIIYGILKALPSCIVVRHPMALFIVRRHLAQSGPTVFQVKS